MQTVVICLVLAAFFFLGIRGSIHRLKHGCCGSGGGQVKRIHVQDHDLNRYPYTAVMKIDGMTCRNCVIKVENAFNSLDGVWARADLEEKDAVIRMKRPLSDEVLRNAVNEAGYLALTVSRKSPKNS